MFNTIELTGCFVDYDPEYPIDYYKTCLRDIGEYCNQSKSRKKCVHWKTIKIIDPECEYMKDKNKNKRKKNKNNDY